jgi:hypothetical protein
MSAALDVVRRGLLNSLYNSSLSAVLRAQSHKGEVHPILRHLVDGVAETIALQPKYVACFKIIAAAIPEEWEDIATIWMELPQSKRDTLRHIGFVAPLIHALESRGHIKTRVHNGIHQVRRTV